MRCDKCQFWMRSSGDRQEVGECHRMPPQIISDSDFACSIDDTSGPTTGFFPETLAKEWCGEWRGIHP